MKESLKPGIEHEFRYRVPPSKTVRALLPESPEFRKMPEVFATGFLVGLVWFLELAGWMVLSAGMAIALAEKGFPTLVPDLRGHGEHPAAFDEKVLEEARAVIDWTRKRYATVGALGSSLGGLLAGASRADFAIAFGPPIVRTPSPEGQYMLRISSHEVRQASPGILGSVMARLIRELPVGEDAPLRIVYAAEEPPDIVKGIEAWAAEHHVATTKVTTGQIPESEGPPGLVRYLPRWLNHTGLPQVALSSDLLAGTLKRYRR